MKNGGVIHDLVILLVKKILVFFSKSFGMVQIGYIPILVPIGQPSEAGQRFMAYGWEVQGGPFSAFFDRESVAVAVLALTII